MNVLAIKKQLIDVKYQERLEREDFQLSIIEEVSILSNGVMFVQKQLATNNTYKGVTITSKGIRTTDNRTYSNIVAQLVQNYDDECTALRIKLAANRDRITKFTQLNEKKIAAALDLVILNTKNELFEVAKELVACRKEDLSELKKLVSIITPEGNTNFDLDVAVLAHFIWSIKAKMHSRDVYYHIMPIFYSTQGAGKTWTVNSLLKPLNDYTARVTMEQVVDTKENFGLSRSYIGFVDELSGANKSCIESLKNRISANESEVVLKYENNSTLIRNNTTYIGCTNKPVGEMIIDSTGMRRFWQINYKAPVLDASGVSDFTEVNSIDYMKIWQGIDESREKGYTDNLQVELEAIQSKSKAVTSIDSYFTENDINVVDGTIGVYVSVMDIYRHYLEYCKNTNFKYPIALANFKTGMESMGFVLKRTANIKCATLIHKKINLV